MHFRTSLLATLAIVVAVTGRLSTRAQTAPSTFDVRSAFKGSLAGRASAAVHARGGITIAPGRNQTAGSVSEGAETGKTVIEGEGLVITPTNSAKPSNAAQNKPDGATAGEVAAPETGKTVIEGEGIVITPANGAKSSNAGKSEPEAGTEGGRAAQTGETVIEGEGIVVRPSPGKEAAAPAEIGEGGAAKAEGGKAEEGTTQTINIGGVPVQVSGSEITLNGKPLEGQEETKTEAGSAAGAKEEKPEEGTTQTINFGGVPVQVSGSEITLNGKPLEGQEGAKKEGETV